MNIDIFGEAVENLPFTIDSVGVSSGSFDPTDSFEEEIFVTMYWGDAKIPMSGFIFYDNETHLWFYLKTEWMKDFVYWQGQYDFKTKTWETWVGNM